MRSNTQTLAAPLAATIEQAADTLGVSRWTIHRLLVAGQIRSVKIGAARRIPMVELTRLLTEGEVSTKRARLQRSKSAARRARRE
jgi:excisionase family DNA binding protein